jgi:P3 major capsid protein
MGRERAHPIKGAQRAKQRSEEKTMANGQQQMSPQQQNAMIRQLILRGGPLGNMYFPPAVDMWQQLNPILPSSVGPGSVITIQLRNVGLVKRLIVEFSATITAGATSAQTLTPLGLANLISNVTFIDLGNNTRINSTGWHLNVVSSVKRRRVFNAAYASDTPNGFGVINNRVMYAPTTIAANGSTPVKFVLEVPFVKNNHDLRGAIFADVTNAVMQVQITLNPQMFVSSTADKTLAVYASGGSDLASLSGVTVQCNQNYLDQLPRNPQNAAPILPALDLGTAYLLNNTASGLPVVNQDNGFSFVNARSYESVAFVFDNNGTLNINGSDLNYIQVTSANFTQILRFDGMMAVTSERDVLGCDLPAGMRYLDFRHRPINTDQYGNMQLIVNPSSVLGSAATILFGWEAYGVIGQVNQAGSLPMAA